MRKSGEKIRGSMGFTKNLIIAILAVSAVGMQVGATEVETNASNALTTEEYADFSINEYDPYEFDEEIEWNPLGDYYGEQNSILYMSSYECNHGRL